MKNNLLILIEKAKTKYLTNKWSKRQLLIATSLSAGFNFLLILSLSVDNKLAIGLGIALLVKSVVVGHNSILPNYLNTLLLNLIKGISVDWSLNHAVSLALISSIVYIPVFLFINLGADFDFWPLFLWGYIYSLALSFYTNVTPLTKFEQRSDVALLASFLEVIIVVFIILVAFIVGNYYLLLAAFPIKEIAKSLLIMFMLDVRFSFRFCWPYAFHINFFNSIYVRNVSLYGAQYFDKLLMMAFIPQQFIGSYAIGSTFGNIVSIIGSNTFLYHIGSRSASEMNDANKSVAFLAITAIFLCPFIYLLTLVYNFSPVFAIFGYFIVSISSFMNSALILFPSFFYSAKKMFAFTVLLYLLIVALMYFVSPILGLGSFAND